jgi:hypothetical protein
MSNLNYFRLTPAKSAISGELLKGNCVLYTENIFYFEWHPCANIIFCNRISYDRVGNLKRLRYTDYANKNWIRLYAPIEFHVGMFPR